MGRVGTFRYLGVWIAAKTPSGKTYVYLTQLRSQQRGGTWEPAYYWGVSDSFEMLPENLTND